MSWLTRLILGSDYPRDVEERAIVPGMTRWAESDVPFNRGGSPVAQIQMSQARALSLAPVFSANRLLAQSISTLPVKAHRKIGDERLPMSALPQLFDQLVTAGQLVPWLHRCVTSLTLRGNAFGLITARDGYGFPTVIEWMNPSDVSDDGNAARPGWFWRGRSVPREDMLHIPWFPVAGEVQGLSPLGAFAATMGVGLRAQEYASEWFAAGGFPPGTFRNTAKPVVLQDEAEAIKARLTNSIRTRQPIVYGSDWEYNPISVPPNEAQFIETTQMTANQIAAIYGIPPEMIGGTTGASMTYANVEQQQINFVMFTLRPWLVLLESAFSALLPDRQYIKFNADALIRADLMTRHEVFRIDREIGLRSLNEMRAMEDLPPIPGAVGNEYVAKPPEPPAIAAPQPMMNEPAGDGNVTDITKKKMGQPR